MASIVGGAVVAVAAAAAAVGGVGGVGATPHVLAVDDSSVDRAIIAAILRSSRFRVTAVESGKRALELLGTEPDVSMIITDYWMPEMTGYELLKKVKESSKLKQIPVVIMSSENVQTRISSSSSGVVMFSRDGISEKLSLEERVISVCVFFIIFLSIFANFCFSSFVD